MTSHIYRYNVVKESDVIYCMLAYIPPGTTPDEIGGGGGIIVVHASRRARYCDGSL